MTYDHHLLFSFSELLDPPIWNLKKKKIHYILYKQFLYSLEENSLTVFLSSPGKKYNQQFSKYPDSEWDRKCPITSKWQNRQNLSRIMNLQ